MDEREYEKIWPVPKMHNKWASDLKMAIKMARLCICEKCQNSEAVIQRKCRRQKKIVLVKAVLMLVILYTDCI